MKTDICAITDPGSMRPQKFTETVDSLMNFPRFGLTIDVMGL